MESQMRVAMLCCLLVVPMASGQVPVPLDRLDLMLSHDDRLEIEIVPILVVDPSIGEETLESIEERVSRTLKPQVDKMFSLIHEALVVLGVSYDVYNLVFGDHFHILVCEEATLYSEQSCIHGDLGPITDLRNFVRDLYDNESPPRGTVQLNVVILEDKLAWSGLLGVAARWYWGDPDPARRHWTNRACRA